MSNPNNPGDPEEMRKLLDRLNAIDPRWWEKIADESREYTEDVEFSPEDGSRSVDSRLCVCPCLVEGLSCLEYLRHGVAHPSC